MRKVCVAFIYAVWVSAGVWAQDFSLAPVTGGTFRFKDCTGKVFADSYIQNHSYANSQVHVTLDDSTKQYLSGSIDATGLKPNFAYQIKLSGRNSKLYSATGDDATNERLGFIGRWWRAYPNPANSTDADYNEHKNDPNYAYSAYLVIAFFVTNEQGAASLHFEGNNSFHVLWRTNQRQPTVNDGPIDDIVIPETAGNPAYGVSNTSQAIGLYGEWEPTRALPNALAMPEAHYACDFILTEESFHDVGTNAGSWPAAMGAPIEFDIGPANNYHIKWPAPGAITYPTALSTTQLNAAAEVAGAFAYTPAMGTVLSPGPHQLSAQFTPGDGGPAAQIQVSLNVLKGTPHLTWNAPKNVRADMPLNDAVLNAESDVAGHFVYSPAPGTSLSSGPHVISAQFVPDDQVDYLIPAPLTVTVEAIAGLLTTSGPWVTPNPAYAGFQVQFVAASEVKGVKWLWNFGDGTAALDANVCAHTFAAAGTYTVTLTAMTKSGQSEMQQVVVDILQPPAELTGANSGGDADGDGFDNGLELAWGSDPAVAASTPLDGMSGATPSALQVSMLNAKILAGNGPARCHCTDRFEIRVKGTIQVARELQVAGKRLGVSVSGLARAMALDERGRGVLDGTKASVKKKAGKGTQVSATLDVSIKGKYDELPLELMEPYATGAERDGWVSVVLDGKLYHAAAKFSIKNGNSAVLLKAK